jgi:tetratricopeptide (TPR) repeat protein/DNA-binding XRE family transcriptional regulator
MPNYQEPALSMGPVGTNIYRVRRKLRITQKQLAAPEFSISYISAIERGRIRPSLKALDILARRLGVSSAELLAELPGGYEVPDEYGFEGAPTTPPSLVQLISQRRSAYPVPLALSWASIALDQHEVQLAEEILGLITTSTLTSEQRLLYSYLLAQVYRATGRPGEARSELEPLFHQEEFSGYKELLERCRFVLAWAYEQQGKLLEAADSFTAAVQAVEKGGVCDPLFAIEVYAEVAEHYRRLERLDVAAEYYQRTLTQLDEVVQPMELALASAHLAQEHLESGRTMLSDWYAGRSRALLEVAESRQRIAQAAIHLGTLHQEMGNAAEAERQLRLSIDLCERLGTHQQTVLARMALADLLLERQELQQAESFALEAEALCGPGEDALVQDETLYGRLLVTLGSIYKAMNRLDEADQTFKRAIELLKAPSAAEHLSRAYYRYSELLHQRSQFAESYELVKQAYLLSQRKRED